jgi:hypothetical protein
MDRSTRARIQYEALVAEADKKVAELTPEQYEKQMMISDLDAITATQILNVNARAFAMGRIPLAISQRVYGSVSPLGWRDNISLAERVMVLTLVKCIVEIEIKGQN